MPAKVCVSFKQEIVKGIHLDTDQYRYALFTEAAALDELVTAYGVGKAAAANEVPISGGPTNAYTRDGPNLNLFKPGGGPGYEVVTSGTVVGLDWDNISFSNVSWEGSNAPRYALIYNASKANRAVCINDFGSPQVTVGDFIAQLTASPGTVQLV